MTERVEARILIVDDEPEVLEGISMALRKHFDVVTATSAVAGMALLKTQGPFVAVVSDMRVPLMDGATFLADHFIGSATKPGIDQTMEGAGKTLLDTCQQPGRLPLATSTANPDW